MYPCSIKREQYTDHLNDHQSIQNPLACSHEHSTTHLEGLRSVTQLNYRIKIRVQKCEIENGSSNQSSVSFGAHVGGALFWKQYCFVLDVDAFST